MFLKERLTDMKNNNSVEKYFYQKNFSLLEIILIIISVISLIVATFVRGGGPVGLPLLLACVVTFFTYRSFKIKDNEIDHTLKKILLDNNISYSENTIECYELKNTVTKKRNDGKIISPNYYITEIIFSSEYTIFNIYIIDLFKQSVEKISHSVNCNESVTLIDETVKTCAGSVKMSYLKIKNDHLIPVSQNDYKSSQLLQKICDRHNI